MATALISSYTRQYRDLMDQEFVIIWVDANIDTSKEDYQHAVEQFRNIVNDVRIFKQLDDTIDFITKLDKMKAFLILSDDTATHISTAIDDIQQIDSIYILSNKNSQHQARITNLWKIRSLHIDVKSICEALQMAVKQYSQDLVLASVTALNERPSERQLNQLHPSFMYTQILKEIFLEMKYDNTSIKAFITCWRQEYADNSVVLRRSVEFESDYHSRSCIWWYACEYFICHMLDQGLRKLDIDTIIKMGFFIHDLHKQIERIHRGEISTYRQNTLTVYRGQGLSKLDFAKLVKSKGDLMSFNNFLSTTKIREIACMFIPSSSVGTDLVGILFRMTIDLSVSSVPFASTEKLIELREEEEILFSMHTVFRIGEIKRIDDNHLHYQVDLELTADADEQLRSLTECMREEILATTSWKRLGKLLLKLNQFDKAEELYNTMLIKTSDQREKADYYHQLGYIKHGQSDYRKAIEYYEKALEISEITLPATVFSSATSYNNLGGVYMNMGDYSQALAFYEKAVGLRQKSFSPNHPLLAHFYNNIGQIYMNMGEYSKALSFYDKALNIRQKTFPANHPVLAILYNNIGGVYYHMGEYSKALSFYAKTYEIFDKTLLPNHPSLATIYNNIATMYYNMAEFSKALSLYEKALGTQQKTLFPTHTDLAASYNNLGELYRSMKEYPQALSYYEKALAIKEKSLPPNHPSLATSYNNIASVYYNMEQYSKAISYFERALKIFQIAFSSDHPNTKTVQANIDILKTKLKNNIE